MKGCVKMARRKMTDKLIQRDSITEELRLIKGSKTDYITPTGKVYKDYGDGMMFPKSVFVNDNNHYLYCNITYPEGQKQRRVHILVAEAYIPNPDNLPVVMHLDDNKQNPCVENLKWGTVSENTKSAYHKGLASNNEGWYDSQSIRVCAFDMEGNYLATAGSVSEMARTLEVTKTTILNQCNHKMKTKPRCGYYFRYLSEYKEKGFVL